MSISTKRIFKKFLESSNKLIETFDPFKKLASFNKDSSIEEINFHKIITTKKFVLSQIFNREIQFELKENENVISRDINNKIILSNFKYQENNNELIIHKKVKDYFIIIQFYKVKPAKDQRQIEEIKNAMIENQNKLFRRNSKSIFKIMGLDNNSDFLQHGNK